MTHDAMLCRHAPRAWRWTGIVAALALCGAGACAGRSDLDASGASVSPSLRGGEYSVAEESSDGSVAPDIDVNAQAAGAPGDAAVTQPRRLVFTGQMQIEVKEPRQAMDGVSAWVAARGGITERSSVSDSPSGTQASMTLRVPSESFDALRAHVRDIADAVLRDEKQREDVTARYADMDARLANLKAAEAELRELLSQARERGGTTEDVLRIHAEVTRVRGEIDGLQAELGALADQVALSTLSLDIVSVAGASIASGGRWRPGVTLRRAWADLLGGLRHLGDFAIYFVVALLPQLLIVGIALWALYRLYRRVRPRRRASPMSPVSRDAPGDAPPA